MQSNRRWVTLFLLLILAMVLPITAIAATANSANRSVTTIELSDKTVDKATAFVGDELVYTILLWNSGLDTLSVTLTDTLPLEVDYVSHTIGEIVPPSGGTGGGGTGTLGGTSLHWSGDLDAGSKVTLTLTVRINNLAEAGESIVNEAEISAAGGTHIKSAETAVWSRLFLPLVMNNAAGTAVLP